MEVTFVPTVPVAPGDPVTVTIGGSTIQTTINTYSSGEASILIQDDSYATGTAVGVAGQTGTDIGSGALKIHVPYYVSGSQGVVSEVSVDVNQMVAAGDTLIKLDEPVFSETYLQLLTARETTLDKLSEKLAQKDQLTVRAPSDGVVDGLTVQQGVSVPEGTALFSVGSVSSYKLVVAVDELDIANVQIGQTADIALDALAGAVYTGKVSRISGTGTYANGMTTYDVTILVDQSDKVLSGMSARADILVASHKDTLLIPVSAIKTIDGGKYVTVMPVPGSKEAVSAPDGVQTQITIGLFNSSQAEVLSGLSEGQYVQDLSVTAVSSGFTGFKAASSGTNTTTAATKSTGATS
jgi:multidrug efflux pump subunit AcrA (membrane-fusion protein)